MSRSDGERLDCGITVGEARDAIATSVRNATRDATRDAIATSVREARQAINMLGYGGFEVGELHDALHTAVRDRVEELRHEQDPDANIDELVEEIAARVSRR